MRIFPDHWAHPDAELEVIETPHGATCFQCEEPIKTAQRGVEMPFIGGPEDPPVIHLHRACFLNNLGVRSCTVCDDQPSFAGCKACGTYRG